MIDRETFLAGGFTNSPDDLRTASVRYWQSVPPEDRMKAIMEIREFHHRQLHPGTGAERMDRSIVGTRRLQDCGD